MDQIKTLITLSRPIDPSLLIPEWTPFTVGLVLLYAVIALFCFVLSLSTYDKGDTTPKGLKFLFAINAALWNVGYLVYYFFIHSVLGF